MRSRSGATSAQGDAGAAITLGEGAVVQAAKLHRLELRGLGRIDDDRAREEGSVPVAGALEVGEGDPMPTQQRLHIRRGGGKAGLAQGLEAAGAQRQAIEQRPVRLRPSSADEPCCDKGQEVWNLQAQDGRRRGQGGGHALGPVGLGIGPLRFKAEQRRRRLARHGSPDEDGAVGAGQPKALGRQPSHRRAGTVR